MSDIPYKEYLSFMREANREMPDHDEYAALAASDALTTAYSLDAYPCPQLYENRPCSDSLAGCVGGFSRSNT